MKLSPARRLDAVDDHLTRIERLQKELRIEVGNLAEEVRVAAAQIRREEKIKRARARGRATAKR